MRHDRLHLGILFALLLGVLGAFLRPAGADEATPAEKAVALAEADPAKLPEAKAAVSDAVTADPKAVLPRLLETRLLLVEAKAKKTAERPAAFAAVLAALAKAAENDRWDARPLQLRLDVFQAMGNPDHAALEDTLRGIAMRLPGDEVARTAYLRQAGKVPTVAEGDPMPRVVWKDAHGDDVPAASLWAKGPVIIELYRSAVWCPYCQKQLFALHDTADKFAEEQITVVACSPDTSETIAKIEKEGLKDRKPLRLRLLSDPQGKTADKLGVLNPDTVKKGVPPEEFGLPFPTTIIVDNRGIVRFVKTHLDFRVRVKPEEMLAVAKRIRVELTSPR